MVEVVLSPGRSVVYSGRSIKITRLSVRLLEFLIAISNARDQPAHVKPKSQLLANKEKSHLCPFPSEVGISNIGV